MSNNETKTPFIFTGFLVEESHITRTPGETDELHLEINPRGIHIPSERTFQLELNVHAFDEPKTFDAQIKAIGFFDFKEVHNAQDLSNYFYVNAPAIIFPYVRAYIAALTSLSGMKPIHLPLASFNRYRDELINNTFEIQADGSEVKSPLMISGKENV